MSQLEKKENSKVINQISSFFNSVFIKPLQAISLRPAALSSDERKSDFQKRLQTSPSSSAKRGGVKKELSFEEKVDLEEQKQFKTPTNVSFFLQLRLQEMEARKLLVEHAVHRAEEMALAEYRISHPPKFQCEQCEEVFPTKEHYQTHMKDKEFHKNYVKKKILLEERFSQIESCLMQGDLGRHLMAYRMIHDPDLGTQMTRVLSAYPDPFRPNLADPTGKRRSQLLRGVFVQGFDPTSGVRPRYKKTGLVSQHLAAKRIAPASNSLYQIHHPTLQEVLMDIMRCQEDFIDLVSTYDHPKSAALVKETGVPYNFALIRFEWHGFSISTVYIKGEFNGWKEEEMLCDYDTSRFYLLKELPTGKYRYRFVVDGQEKYDSYCSFSADKLSPVGYSNDILVSNSPLLHVPRQRAIPPSPMVLSSKNYFRSIQANSLKMKSSQSQRQMTSSLMSKTPTEISFPVKSSHVSSNQDDDSVHSELSDGVEELLRSSPSLDRSRLRVRIADPSQSASQQHPSQSAASPSRASDRELPPGTINHVQGMDREAMIHQLESINLRNLGLYDDGCWALAINIKRNSFIIHLDLSFNEISDDGVQALSDCLLKLVSLKTLKLNGNGFGYDGCRCLSRSLAKSETIQVLELCSNKLGDDAIEELCFTFLRYHESIQYLYLDSNFLGNDGMEAMRDMLIHNRSLLHLSLMDNKFDFNGVNSLLLGLKWNAQLISLNISNNPTVGSLGTKCLGEVLFFNNTIQNLEMSHVNMFSGRNLSGLTSLCYGLKKNTSLIRLVLRGNHLRDYHLVDLSDAILQNNKLLVLDLSGNDFKNPAWLTRETFLTTHLRPQQPSIATILYRNNLFVIREGRKVAEMMRAFSPPDHQEQLREVEAWKASLKNKIKFRDAVLPIPGLKPHDHAHGQHQNGPEAEERPFSPYQAPAFPFRSPLQSRAASPDYGQVSADQAKLDDDGNLRIFSDKRKNALLAVAPPPSLQRLLVNHIVDDVKHGHWTMRRMWRRIPPDNDEKKAAEAAKAAEYERMLQERAYLKKHMRDYMTAMAQYLEEAPCQEFLQTIARIFVEYFHALAWPATHGQGQGHGQEKSKKAAADEAEEIVIRANFAFDKHHEDEAFVAGQELLDNQRNQREVQFFRGKSFRGLLAEIEEEEAEADRKKREAQRKEFAALEQEFQEKQAALEARRRKKKFVKKPNDLAAMPPDGQESLLGLLLEAFQLSRPPAPAKVASEQSSQVQTKKSSLFSFLAPKPSAAQAQEAEEEEEEAKKRKKKAVVAKPTIRSILREQFMNVHVSLLQAIFTLLESGHKTLLLHPEKLEIALNMLCLPAGSVDQLQEIVDATLIPSIERIGFHKFSTHLLLALPRLVRANPSKRTKLLRDAKYFHPPLKEAKSVVLSFLSANALTHFRHYFRLNLRNKPRHVCSICLERFATERELQRHLAKDILLPQSPSSKSGKGRGKGKSGREEPEERRTGTTLNELLGKAEEREKRRRNTKHKRLLLEKAIYEAQFLLLKEVKFFLTGVRFPAYFELLPAETLPEDYLPQVFDQMGKLGRPMAVVEPFRTVRALDVLGEFLLVTLRGLTGWIRYRAGRTLFLRPLAGFDWDAQRVQETVSYYRVNDNLPPAIELKVRHRPDATTGEVLGYLRPGQVVPCYAVVGDWLQVKYGDEDAAWVMWRTSGEREQAREIAAAGKGSGAGERPGERFLKPIRKRKIDYSAKPSVASLGGFDDGEDGNYDDAIISYEIDGRAHRTDVLKNPAVSALKIQFFDFVRYGSRYLRTNLDHLLLVPFILQEKLLTQPRARPPSDDSDDEAEAARKKRPGAAADEEDPGKFFVKVMNRSNLSNQFEQWVLQAPFLVGQQELFDLIVGRLDDRDIFNFFCEIGLERPSSAYHYALADHPPQQQPEEAAASRTSKKAPQSKADARSPLQRTASASSPGPAPPLLGKGRRYQSERIRTDGAEGEEEDEQIEDPRAAFLQGRSFSQKIADEEAEERERRIAGYFGGGLRDEVYEELVLQDDIFDDLDLMSV